MEKTIGKKGFRSVRFLIIDAFNELEGLLVKILDSEREIATTSDIIDPKTRQVATTDALPGVLSRL